MVSITDPGYFQKSADLYHTMAADILKDARDNYPHLLNPAGVNPKHDPEYYPGCGCTGSRLHVLLAFNFTLPIFKNLGKDAREQLIKNFGWERQFENYTLKDEFKTSYKAIKFFAKNLTTDNRRYVQGFIFSPKQLNEVVKIVSPKIAGSTPLQITKEALENRTSQASQILLELTFDVLKEEKKRIAKKQWEKAKDSFKKFSFCKGFRYISKRFQIIFATDQLIRVLKKISNDPLEINLGEQFFTDDVKASRCQLDIP